jgi:hypothetical protein
MTQPFAIPEDRFPASPPARRLRQRARLLPLLLLGLLGLPAALPAQGAPPKAPPAGAPRAAAEPAPTGWNFGDRVVVRNCLRFQVTDYRDRQGDVDNHDWVHVRAENACPQALRNVLVELLLVDTRGARYGTPVWVIGKGERLDPGGVWEDDVAIPDPDSRVARRWTLRLLRADGLPRSAPAVKKDGKKKG